jgi:hypothetical protein
VQDDAVSSASLDRLLGALLAIAGGSGLLTLAAGSPDATWLFVLHGVLGASLVAAVATKLWRAVPRAVAGRHWRRLSLAGLVTLCALLSALAALAQAGFGSVVVIGPWTLISWHAYAGLALAPLLIAHLLPVRWRLLKPRDATRRTIGAPPPTVSRRAVLQMGAIGLAGIGLWSLAQVSGRIAGGVRRFTGSHAVAVAVPPATTFFGEPTPRIDPAAWRLRVVGRVARPLVLMAGDLGALPTTTKRAVLDCTSGWSADCEWTGVSLATLLTAVGPSPDATSIQISSVTGWSAVLPLDAADRSLLAVAVGGAPLQPGNGAPVRLVVPDRRGLEWVKWVDRIEVR